MPRFVFPQIIPEFLVFRQSLVRKNFDNHRDWQKTIELLNDISEEKSYANVIKDAKNLKNLDRLLEKTEHNAEVLESLLKVILQVQVKK